MNKKEMQAVINKQGDGIEDLQKELKEANIRAVTNMRDADERAGLLEIYQTRIDVLYEKLSNSTELIVNLEANLRMNI